MKKIIYQGECGKCASESLDYGDTTNEDECMGYEYVCQDCGFEGIEWYSLTFIEHANREGIAMPREIEISKKTTNKGGSKINA